MAANFAVQDKPIEQAKYVYKNPFFYDLFEFRP